MYVLWSILISLISFQITLCLTNIVIWRKCLTYLVGGVDVQFRTIWIQLLMDMYTGSDRARLTHRMLWWRHFADIFEFQFCSCKTSHVTTFTTAKSKNKWKIPVTPPRKKKATGPTPSSCVLLLWNPSTESAAAGAPVFLSDPVPGIERCSPEDGDRPMIVGIFYDKIYDN
jgi:hypothetical protein